LVGEHRLLYASLLQLLVGQRLRLLHLNDFVGFDVK
jgi:hypothetical protein